MGAIGQEPFHFAFFSGEHPSDLFCVDWFQFLLGHSVLHAARFFLLPGPGSPCETVFGTDQETIEEEKEHMAEFRKWDRNQHDHSR